MTLDISQIKETAGLIGNYIAIGTTWIIKQLASLGMAVTDFTSKIISLIILVSLLFISSKMFHGFTKIALIILFSLLALSVGITLIPSLP
jgi:hypothetical protein